MLYTFGIWRTAHRDTIYTCRAHKSDVTLLGDEVRVRFYRRPSSIRAYYEQRRREPIRRYIQSRLFCVHVQDIRLRSCAFIITLWFSCISLARDSGHRTRYKPIIKSLNMRRASSVGQHVFESSVLSRVTAETASNRLCYYGSLKSPEQWPSWTEWRHISGVVYMGYHLKWRLLWMHLVYILTNQLFCTAARSSIDCVQSLSVEFPSPQRIHPAGVKPAVANAEYQ